MMRCTSACFAKKRNAEALSKAPSPFSKKLNSKEVMELEAGYSANNYAPIPVVFSKAKGIVITDPEGKTYFDFLSGYSTLAHGHCHPKLIAAASKQMKQCALSSRAFFNDRFGAYAKFITEYLGYDRVLPMNSGAEGVETALKIARRWGYECKKIKNNKAIIVSANNNFHGRTFGAISMSTDPSSFEGYGPNLPGFKRVKFGDAAGLEAMFKKHQKQICAFIVEPIQGEAGVVIPPEGYLKEVRRLCTKYNILFIADEVQTGLGRTGKLLAVDHENVRPDMVILGKALSGGLYPISAVMADDAVMGVITPGTHGSTFGGNPLASVIATESLRLLQQEKLVENSASVGDLLKQSFLDITKNHKFVSEVRGRGLFIGMVFDKKAMGGNVALRVSMLLAKDGILAKPTHGNIIRFSPPLVITKKQAKLAVAKVEKVLNQVSKEL